MRTAIQICGFWKHWGIVNILLLLCITSCEDFLNISPPGSKIPTDVVFQDDDMAKSAIAGIYINLYASPGFGGGGLQSVLVFGGLSSDELHNNNFDALLKQIEDNEIRASNPYLDLFWNSMYKVVYQTNVALEGLEASNTLTTAVKNQLKGEALFIRAFCYFYLTNFFGDVPLALTSNYKENNTLHRTAELEVYNQIIADLLTAEDLLGEQYANNERIRPNKFAATAMLARVYLYKGDWARAEDKATSVITRTDLFSLLGNLNTVFLANSKEAIWQLRPYDGAAYTNEGYWFSTQQAPTNNILTNSVLNAFESPDDKRKTNWITSATTNSTTVYLPFKYKRYLPSGQTDEYSMVIRLAEIYLIRAEARLNQSKFSGAVSDIDNIRLRAGLKPFEVVHTDITEDSLRLSIENERRIEFLTEWAHRWLDIKRWNRSEAILSPVKQGWSIYDSLYPIPAAEISKNENLKPQNVGY